jgi:hypothetical protein
VAAAEAPDEDGNASSIACSQEIRSKLWGRVRQYKKQGKLIPYNSARVCIGYAIFSTEQSQN